MSVSLYGRHFESRCRVFWIEFVGVRVGDERIWVWIFGIRFIWVRFRQFRVRFIGIWIDRIRNNWVRFNWLRVIRLRFRQFRVWFIRVWFIRVWFIRVWIDWFRDHQDQIQAVLGLVHRGLDRQDQGNNEVWIDWFRIIRIRFRQFWVWLIGIWIDRIGNNGVGFNRCRLIRVLIQGSSGSGTSGSGSTGSGSTGSGSTGSGSTGSGSGSSGSGSSGSSSTGSGSTGSTASGTTGSGPYIPSNATVVSGIQALSGWTGVDDPGTYGTADGAMAMVSAPSLSGNALEFYTTYTYYGGERYYFAFSNDTTSSNFVYDGWVYLDNSSGSIANLEMDMNQVMANGETVILGFQCDGWSGTWDYTENAGTPTAPIDHWVNSSAPCNVKNWAQNVWHHVQVSYSRDDYGNVTYQSVWLDGNQQQINATVPSRIRPRLGAHACH